jgi:hypothetical protein
MTVLALGRFVTTMKAIQTSMDTVKKSCLCDNQSAIALADDAKAQLLSQKAELRKSESELLWDSPSTEGWWAAMGGAPLVVTPEEQVVALRERLAVAADREAQTAAALATPEVRACAAHYAHRKCRREGTRRRMA